MRATTAEARLAEAERVIEFKDKVITGLETRAEQAEARAEALRAALEEIAEWDCLAAQGKTGMTLMSQVGLLRTMAQAALSPEHPQNNAADAKD